MLGPLLASNRWTAVATQLDLSWRSSSFVLAFHAIMCSRTAVPAGPELFQLPKKIVKIAKLLKLIANAEINAARGTNKVLKQKS